MLMLAGFFKLMFHQVSIISHVTVFTVTLLMTPVCPMRSMKESLIRTKMSVVTQSLLPCSMLEPGV